MDSWTLWSEQQPTDAKLVYRWRIPAQEILGLVMQPEWSEKLFSPLCQPDIYFPSCARWDGWKWHIPNGLEWRVASPNEPEGEKGVVWGGLDLLPCPFTGKLPTVIYHGRYIGAPPYHAEWLGITSFSYVFSWYIVRSIGWRQKYARRMEYEVYPRTTRTEVAPKGAFLVAMMSSAGCLLAQSEISTGGSISSPGTSGIFRPLPATLPAGHNGVPGCGPG